MRGDGRTYPRVYARLTTGCRPSSLVRGSFPNTGPAEHLASSRPWLSLILRTTDATGEVYDDPSEDALHMFLEDLASPGSVVRVERLENERKGEWAQVAMTEAGLYEFDTSEHVRYVSSLRTIHEFLTRWAFDLPTG